MNDLKEKLIRLQTKRELLQLELKNKDYLANHWNSRYNSGIKSRSLIQEVAKQTQSKLKFHISNFVTTCLHSIPFKDNYDFEIEFEIRRNKTECDIWLTKGGERVKPTDSSGGGVCDITSLGLLLAFYFLKPNRPLMIWDEPCKHLSKDYSPAAGDMIKMLTDKLKMQILMVTHNKDLAKAADNLIEV